MKPPLFILFNIGSGEGDAAAARATIESACAEAGRELHLSTLDEPGQIGKLARQLVQRAQQAKGVVVAAGGDGTINAVAQATLGSGCEFGVLPKGTFNYFSRTHGIPAELPQALQVLLNETAQPVQVGLVNERVFLVNASLGLYPQLLEEREAWKKKLGRNRLVALAAGLWSMLRSHRSLRLRMEVNGQMQDLRTPTLFVGNNALQMEQFGLPEAQAIDAGQLAGITLRTMGRWARLGLLARAALGRLGRLAEADEVVNFAFSRLTVLPSRAFGKRRAKVATDGEIGWMQLPLEFRVAPQPLMLIRPQTPAPERASP